MTDSYAKVGAGDTAPLDRLTPWLRRILALLALSGAWSACGADELPGTPQYLGEVRRDASGKLVTVPAPATAETAVKPSGRILKVGPNQQIRLIATAAKLAQDGDTIEIEAGDYPADVAIWKQNELTIRGVGGRARLIAARPHRPRATRSSPHQDFADRRMAEKHLRTRARTIRPGLEDHDQIPRLGLRQFHPVGEQIERRT